MATDTTPQTAGLDPDIPGTRYAAVFAALGAPFELSELRYRLMKNEDGSQRKEYYVRSRSIMNRLDNVMGPEGWEDDYLPFGANGAVKCFLTLTMADGRKVRKSGVGSPNRKGAANDDKAAESDALKRAALKFGVARYLYRDGVPVFVSERTTLDGPAVPFSDLAERRAAAEAEAALADRQGPPAARPPRDRSPEPARPPQSEPMPGRGTEPKTGKALFSWAKDREEEYEVGLVKYLDQWGRLNEFPARMIDWDAKQVELGHREAVRKLRVLQTQGASA